MPPTPYYADDLVTLYHGDCRGVTEWLAADVLVTDPPYGVGYFSERRRDEGGRRIMGAEARSANGIRGDNDTALRDTALALWGSDRPALVFGHWRAPRPAGTRMRLVWDKRGGTGYSGDPKMPWAEVTEEVYVLGSGWVGRRRPNILAVPTYNSQAKARPKHPTPKPVPLMLDLIQHCPPGSIADPFAGSGATLLAARQLGRPVIGVEVEERYCELIARRLTEQPLVLDLPA